MNSPYTHPDAVAPVSVSTGLKHNKGKAPLDLISPLAAAYLAQVLAFGAEKYAAHNWRGGIKLSYLLAACQRHILAIQAGIDNDEETGLPHAAHLMCEAMFMVDQMNSIHHKLLDDRFKDTDSKKNLLVAVLAGDVNAIQKQLNEIHTLQSNVTI